MAIEPFEHVAFPAGAVRTVWLREVAQRLAERTACVPEVNAAPAERTRYGVERDAPHPGMAVADKDDRVDRRGGADAERADLLAVDVAEFSAARARRRTGGDGQRHD